MCGWYMCVIFFCFLGGGWPVDGGGGGGSGKELWSNSCVRLAQTVRRT